MTQLENTRAAKLIPSNLVKISLKGTQDETFKFSNKVSNSYKLNEFVGLNCCVNKIAFSCGIISVKSLETQ